MDVLSVPSQTFGGIMDNSLEVYDLLDFFESYGGGVVQGVDPNQFSTKPICFDFNEIGVKTMNVIYNRLLKSGLHIIKRTPSGGIAKCFNNRYAYDIYSSPTGFRITVLISGITFVYKIGHIDNNAGKIIAPWKAWKILCNELSNDDINIFDYCIENGEEIKGTIQSPLIKMYNHMGANEEGLKNVHHIDFHSSYAAGLANTHPEFKKTLERIYKKRREDATCKAILNESIGAMQSLKKPWNAQWAHLSKDAIEDNNKRILNLTFMLEISGRKILGHNTDGIWYQGEIYHGEGEGNKLGEWDNDHINCIFRSKSDGAYEYIDGDGKYTPVVRGYTSLDKIKPRDLWKWGDIYDNDSGIIQFEFKEGKGIMMR